MALVPGAAASVAEPFCDLGLLMAVVSNLHIPPATHDVRAEQPDRVEKKLEVFSHRVFGQVRKLFSGRGRLRRLVARIEAAEPRLQALDNQQLQQEIQQLRQQLHIDGMIDELLVCSFALVRELSVRTPVSYTHLRAHET